MKISIEVPDWALWTALGLVAVASYVLIGRFVGRYFQRLGDSQDMHPCETQQLGAVAGLCWPAFVVGRLVWLPVLWPLYVVVISPMIPLD